MAAYLPKGWLSKQVVVMFRPEGSLKGSLFSWSEGGVFLHIVEAERTRKLFIPWSSIRYVELLETDEGEAT